MDTVFQAITIGSIVIALISFGADIFFEERYGRTYKIFETIGWVALCCMAVGAMWWFAFYLVGE